MGFAVKAMRKDSESFNKQIRGTNNPKERPSGLAGMSEERGFSCLDRHGWNNPNPATCFGLLRLEKVKRMAQCSGNVFGGGLSSAIERIKR
jgi:hypothetical protein